MKNIITDIDGKNLSLIQIFFKANDMTSVKIESEYFPVNIGEFEMVHPYIKLTYEEDSDDGINISFMATKHLGLENMLIDYLLRCGITSYNICPNNFTRKKEILES